MHRSRNGNQVGVIILRPPSKRDQGNRFETGNGLESTRMSTSKIQRGGGNITDFAPMKMDAHFMFRGGAWVWVYVCECVWPINKMRYCKGMPSSVEYRVVTDCLWRVEPRDKFRDGEFQKARK